MQNRNENKIDELFLCVTPLQMLIAESIVLLQKEKSKVKKNYAFIIITYDDNDKYKWYSDRLRKLSSDFVYFIVKGDSKFSRFGEVVRFKKAIHFLKKSYFYVCYLASIENPFVLYALSVLKVNEIQTFDDGTANIDKSSIYYRQLHRGVFEKGLKKMLGIKYNREDIVQASTLHYTLYNGCSNIIEKTYFIDLMKAKKELPDLKDFDKFEVINDKITIFLGQPVIGIDPSIDVDFVNKVIKDSGATYYLPHPRERIIIDNIEYIKTSLIFEDFILLLKQEYPTAKIVLNTFFSSAVLNVSSLTNIEINVFSNAYLDKEYANIYNLFNVFGINKIII